MSSWLKRLTRIRAKLALRASLACRFATSFEDAPHRAQMKVSYSQCGEDMIVWSLFALLGKSAPSYLDIGAHHPTYLSNTALFSLLGARGINIEPDPELFAAFSRARPRDINLNIGVAETSGTLPFYRMADPTLNTFSSAEAEQIRMHRNIAITATVPLPVEPIAAVLEQWKFVPDFVSLDVEGRDLEILRTFDFERHRPLMLCVETLDFSTSPEGRKNGDLISYVEQQGFEVYADTYINTLFVDGRRIPLSGSIRRLANTSRD
jgi:FkbM family methyltransferase